DDRVAEDWDRRAVDADLAREVDRLRVGDRVRVALRGEGRARGVRIVDGDDAVRGHLAVVLEGDDVAEADRGGRYRLDDRECALVDVRLHRAARDDEGAHAERA